jgi:hypothetical protein
MMKRLLLALLLVLPGRVAAQDLAAYDYENLTFRGIGFDYGYIWPSKVEPTSMYTLRVDLGFLGPAVRLAPSISYWTSKLRSSELERLADRLELLPPLRADSIELSADDFGEVLWSDLGLALDAHIVWTVPFDIITFVGAGASLHALNGRGVSIDDTFIEGLLDSTAAGIALMAGAEVQPMPGVRLYGEARYTVVSDVRYPALRIGAALMLPPRAATPEGGR